MKDSEEKNKFVIELKRLAARYADRPTIASSAFIETAAMLIGVAAPDAESLSRMTDMHCELLKNRALQYYAE
jgi:hypothetical protein